MLTETWHRRDLKVLYHSDGSYKKAVPDLLECGVDGFYCLEPSCGMHVVELKQKWPGAVWLGGVDGVDLMENGTPEQVRKEVHRHITETGALSKRRHVCRVIERNQSAHPSRKFQGNGRGGRGNDQSRVQFVGRVILSASATSFFYKHP